MAAFQKVFSNRPFVGMLLFVAFVYILEEGLFAFPQTIILQFATLHFTREEILVFVVSSIGSFVIFCLFVWATLQSSPMVQVLCAFLFGVSSVVQYGFRKAVQRFLVPEDLTIAGATTIDIWKGAGVLYFNWYSILPVIGFILVLFLFSRRQALKTNFAKFGVLLILTVVLNFSYRFIVSRAFNLGQSFPSFCQTISRFVIDSMLPPMREMINCQHPGAPQNNIVLIIDESIRGDHLSVNGYGRDTTPYLNTLADFEDGFYSFGSVVSGATCSFPSNALILTGVRPGLDEFDLTARYPTIFQYAKAMGYKTYFLDDTSESFWDGLTERDLTFIDTWFKADTFGKDYDSDFRAADKIAQIVSEGSGNFIVLNKRGVHFLYRYSYPPEAAIWLPIPEDHLVDPKLISNPYDNGIHYNVNTFFKRLLVNLKILENTTILYTSDHGQTLFSKGTTWLACKNSPDEAIVPMVLIGRNIPAVDVEYHASHSNILPTLLDLMGVPSDQRMHPYAPSLFSVTGDTVTDRFYFDGSLQLFDFPDLPLEVMD